MWDMFAPNSSEILPVIRPTQGIGRITGEIGSLTEGIGHIIGEIGRIIQGIIRPTEGIGRITGRISDEFGANILPMTVKREAEFSGKFPIL
jgi:hypothetical protein